MFLKKLNFKNCFKINFILRRKKINFQIKYKNEENKIIKEKVFNTSESEIFSKFILNKKELIDIKELKEEKSLKKISKKKKSEYINNFIMMLNTLLSGGLQIKEALETIKNSWKLSSYNPAELLLNEINKGKTFSLAAKSLDDFFPELFIQLIDSGEKTGRLNEVFMQLSKIMDFKNHLHKKIISSLTYPLIVLSTSIISIFAMMIFIFPRFKEMFESFNEKAGEEITKNINVIQNFLELSLVLPLGFFILAYFFNKQIKNNIEVKEKRDSLLLKIPFFGKLIVKYQTMNFSFIMETLTYGGISIEESLLKAEESSSNEAFKSEINKIRKDVIKGISFSESIKKSRRLPVNVKNLVIAGEKSGDIKTSFSKLKNFYQKEVESSFERLITFIEPSLTLLTGIFLLVIVITIIVPVFSLYGTVLQ